MLHYRELKKALKKDKEIQETTKQKHKPSICFIQKYMVEQMNVCGGYNGSRGE